MKCTLYKKAEISRETQTRRMKRTQLVFKKNDNAGCLKYKNKNQQTSI